MEITTQQHFSIGEFRDAVSKTVLRDKIIELGAREKAGRLIEAARMSAGLSHREFATRMKIEVYDLANLEAGRPVPGRDLFHLIHLAAHVSGGMVAIAVNQPKSHCATRPLIKRSKFRRSTYLTRSA